tara:strand:+ start:71 stop:475 length:405 start_codon:yes stop_codon:yes gene_type:complete
MGNILSISNNNLSNISLINFEKLISTIKNCDGIIINTLDINIQDCLISGTIPCDKECDLINSYISKNKNVKIIIYGKNASDISTFKKYLQLINLGFTNVSIYTGGMFEWLLLQEVYGNEDFTTTSVELDILKYR